MTTTDHGWEVLDEEAGVLTREYQFTEGGMARMMTARCADGSLVAISPAPSIDEKALQELSRFGTVGALIAPNGFHHMGLRDWHRAFPDAQLLATEEAAERITKKVPGLPSFGGLASLSLPEGTSVVEAPAQKIGETWLRVRASAGTIWYTSDTFFSLAEPPPKLIPRLLFSWFKCAPGFRFNRLSLALFAKDKPAYKAWMLTQLEQEAPDIIVTAHGEVVRGEGLKERCIEQIHAAIA